MMDKLMYKVMNFMRGRYGSDGLNQTLLIACIICFILDMFLDGFVLGIIGYVLWGLSVFRMLSKNIYKRQQENVKFEKLINPITKQINLMKKQKADPANRYYRCKTCGQIVRVPKGRGKIEIRCPKCQSRFEKRT